MAEDQDQAATEAARALAARRRRVQKSCEVCGKQIEGTVRRRYCSAACLQRAAYARRGAEIRAVKKAWRDQKKTDTRTE